MLAQSSDCPPFLLFLFLFLLCAKPLKPFMQRQSHNEAKKNRDKKDVPCPQLVVAMRRLLGTWKTETYSLESTDMNCHDESPSQVCGHPPGFLIYTPGRSGKPSWRRRPYAESRMATRNQPSLQAQGLVRMRKPTYHLGGHTDNL